MPTGLRRIKETETDTSHLLLKMSIIHNNCGEIPIESLQNVMPTSTAAIADLCADKKSIEALPHVYSVSGPGVQRYYSESLAEIIERALDYYSELTYHCAPEPAMFKIVITDGRENAMWHQPFEAVYALCPVKFVSLANGDRFVFGTHAALNYPIAYRKKWQKESDSYMEDAAIWVPLRDKSKVLTAKTALKCGPELKRVINNCLAMGLFYEDAEDAVSDALLAATFAIPR